MQQNTQQQVISPQRTFSRRSVGGSSTLFGGFMMSLNGSFVNLYCFGVLFILLLCLERLSLGLVDEILLFV
jgi:hypothetical protein